MDDYPQWQEEWNARPKKPKKDVTTGKGAKKSADGGQSKRKRGSKVHDEDSTPLAGKKAKAGLKRKHDEPDIESGSGSYSDAADLVDANDVEDSDADGEPMDLPVNYVPQWTRSRPNGRRRTVDAVATDIIELD